MENINRIVNKIILVLQLLIFNNGKKICLFNTNNIIINIKLKSNLLIKRIVY